MKRDLALYFGILLLCGWLVGVAAVRQLRLAQQTRLTQSRPKIANGWQPCVVTGCKDGMETGYCGDPPKVEIGTDQEKQPLSGPMADFNGNPSKDYVQCESGVMNALGAITSGSGCMTVKSLATPRICTQEPSGDYACTEERR